jgi:hypothetical protein
MKNLLKSNIFLTFGFALILLLFLGNPAFSMSYKLAFLEAEDKVPVEDESEYNWAKENNGTTLIHPNGAGKFKDDAGKSVKLEDFQIVWWHRANAKTIPPVFLENSTKSAFLDYVEGGGSLFLSQVALHYVFDLGLEKLEPRMCDPNADHALSGIIAAEGQEKHPLFDGFAKMGVDPVKGFNIDCYGHDCMADFYPNGPAKGGTIAVMEWQDPLPAWFGQVTPMVEYKVGKGTILTSGWRFTVFRSVDEKCKYSNNMIKLHENVMNYLGTLADVESQGKLSATWGMIKKD